MDQTLKRALSGVIYVAIMWFGASYSEKSYSILFIILGIMSLFEMWKLRIGKSKLLAFLYVTIPFLLIQFPEFKNSFVKLYMLGLQKDINDVFNPSLMLYIFLLTWTFDTSAYIVGVKFGKHKILPAISPKKSWEGLFGGIIFTILVGYLTPKYFLEANTLSLFKLFGDITILKISILLPFTATFGDFIASYYKRKAGVKNSGNLIPGHGGMLDRMDAFMITIPAIYILLNLL